LTVAIVLAGGLGTRLRGAVPDLPKPMAPINGRPFLEHQFDYWIAQGVDRFIVSVGYRREAITGHFGSRYRGVPVHYAVEETPLGTGGGLLLAVAQLTGTEPVLVLNGDTYFEVSLPALARFHAATGSDWTFTLFRAEEAGRYMGMDIAPDGRVQSLRSGTGTPGRLANGGAYLVSPECLRGGWEAGSKLSLEDDLLPALFIRARLFGLECAGRFIDIGVPHDYERAGQLLAA
jgi:D-glycero-alpha-D-manno-heptose 1-phosphate guanylyltransferase